MEKKIVSVNNLLYASFYNAYKALDNKPPNL